MYNRRAKKKLTLALDESGAAAIVIAIVFAVLCGFVGLAVDIGHMVMVKAELQRTADAGALAGALGLAPYIVTTPDWDTGKAKAHIIISNPANKANYLQFTETEGTVLAGYWSLKPPTNYVQTLPQTRPDVSFIPEPAVKVTLTRPVDLIIAPVLPGINRVQNVSATAAAILPALSTGTFSMAVEKSLVDAATGNVDILVDVVDFGWHDQGQWYTEQDITHQYPDDEGNNDVTTVRKNGPVKKDDYIWIAPGAMDTLYHDILIDQTVILPVVESVQQKQWQQIFNFASFYITDVTPHSIHGYFVEKNIDNPSVPSAWGTPRLVSP
jgi:Flp pilus assembly protein TadG